MKKVGKILAVLAAILVIAAIVVLFVADRKYQFLFAGPKVSHESLATPGVSLRAVVKPALAKSLILAKLGSQAPPEFLLDRALPYEAALLAAPDLDAKRMDVTLFVNPQRLTPFIADGSKSLGIPRQLPFINWQGDALSQSANGVLSLAGSIDIDDLTVSAVREKWGVVTVPGRPLVSGTHLAEIAIDNRDGSLFAVLSLFANKGIIALPVKLESLRTSLAPVGIVSITGDLQGVDTLALHMQFECIASAEEGQVNSVGFIVAGILGEVKKALATKGVEFKGDKKTDGMTIIADYTMSNVGALISL